MVSKVKIVDYCDNKINSLIILGDPYKEKEIFSTIRDLMKGDISLNDIPSIDEPVEDDNNIQGN